MKARSCHAPARRLARTTISLGPEEGILFGLRAIRWGAFPADINVSALQGLGVIARAQLCSAKALRWASCSGCAPSGGGHSLLTIL